eukprot:comp16736_c0_seq1/m.15042 comp16736_c0_seq1/g.15042  ORF comp16736_c0_seq1/g.15042 comp16736_c0_seq1/m.15042 type:complete len:485 (-) comp16736_c0_seq1:404-1858(-)
MHKSFLRGLVAICVFHTISGVAVQNGIVHAGKQTRDATPIISSDIDPQSVGKATGDTQQNTQVAVAPPPPPSTPPQDDGAEQAQAPTTSASVTPRMQAPSSGNTCGTCPISIGSTCYNTLAEAITAAPDGGVIQISSDITVESEIEFSKSISLVGCGSHIYASFNGQSDDAAILRLSGDGQSLKIKDLKFERKGEGLASAIRTPELGDGSNAHDTTSTVAVTIEKSSFANFRVEARGGGAIFLGQVSELTISDCDFEGNSVQKWGTHYDGCGAVWVYRIKGKVEITGSTFAENVHEFEHGLGGAFGADEVDAGASLSIQDSMFRGNKAAGGGAIYISTIHPGADVVISGTFTDNTAVEQGWGSRGGAIWVEFVCGNTEISGTFANNQAPNDRGGAIANNRITGKLTIEGDFEDNVSKLSGSVFDSVHGFEPLDGVTEGNSGQLKLNAYLSGNRNKDGSDMSIRTSSSESGTTLYGNGHMSGTYS